jgi:hypothetical protein
MRVRTWLGICAALGLLAGAATVALTPARYRALTTLDVQATRGAGTPDDDLFPYRLRDQLDGTLRSAVSEENMVRLMQAHDLYKTERESGRAWDALLRLRRSIHVVRKRESDTTERWTVAFEADDPAAAERGSSGLAELIKREGDTTLETRPSDFDIAIGPLLEDAKERLVASESKMKAWVRAHGGGPPAAMLTETAGLHDEFVTLLRRAEDERPPRPQHWRPPIETEFTIVKSPRVSDGRIALRFCRSPGAALPPPFFLGWLRCRSSSGGVNESTHPIRRALTRGHRHL